MQQIARQLERVRSTARWMLVGQCVARWLSAVVAGAVVLGLLDYALRLPGSLRLIVGLLVLGFAVAWLVIHLPRALRFRPELDELALRLERMYPHLTGQLATAVDFATHPHRYATPTTTADLAQQTVEGMRSRLAGVEPRRLLDSSRTMQYALLLLLTLVLLAVFVVGAPAHARIAFERWVLPLGESQWPRWVNVAGAMDTQVWPADTPVVFAANVPKGYEPGMRVAVRYRITEPGAPADSWRTLIMTEQAADASQGHRFERQVEVPERLARSLELRGGAAQVEYTFSAGDDTTSVTSFEIVARPAITRVEATLTPPAYAQPFVAEQNLALHEQGGQTAGASALQGSTVRLTLAFNKPVPPPASLGDLAPGMPASASLAGQASAEATEALTVVFPLEESFETTLRLVDEHGLANLSDRRYRFEAVEDKPPTVTLTRPGGDESVLARASVPLAAEAQDDVAIRGVAMERQVERQGVAASDAAPEDGRTLLARREAQARDASVSHVLDLATQSPALRPGDVVVLNAVARDVFERDGARHDVVRSAARRLRIIDEAALIGQLRSELAAVRQQAVRLEQAQRDLLENADLAPEQVANRQGELSRRLDAQRRLVAGLKDRADQNRLEEPALDNMLERSGELLSQAQQASGNAERALADAAAAEAPQERQQQREQATRDQAGVQQRLAELVSLLDEGRDAASIELQLRQLRAQQQDLAQASRELFPQTVGRDMESLPQELRDRLRELAQRQEGLSEQAREAIRQMQEAAHELAQQEDDDRAQAAAESLAEAAATAQRRGLEQQMQQSSQSLEQNQLSQAGESQSQAMSTLEEMLRQMGEQDERRMARLRRRMEELAQALERLITQQSQRIAELDALPADADVAPLAPPQTQLRQATIAVEESAMAAEGMEAVGQRVAAAVEAQGHAILALRDARRLPAKESKTAALSALREALERLRQLQQEAAEQEARDQRAQLRQAYLDLAEQQDELQAEVEPLAAKAELDRRERANVVRLGQSQSTLRTRAAELGEQAGEAGGGILFRHLHERMDRLADRLVTSLRRGTADAATPQDQARIAAMLRAIAAALEEDPQAEPFAGEQGGGGGGGGGEQPQAIPELTELRLLRDLQAQIHEQTREISESMRGPLSREQQAALIDLSVRQRELAGLGEELIQQAQQRMQPGGGP